MTGYVKWDLIRAIAPAIHRLPKSTLREILSSLELSHAMSHELEYVDAAVLPEIVEILCDHSICFDRISDIVRLARSYPGVGDALLGKWRQLANDGADSLGSIRFPGQALVPLVEQGHAEAIRALIAWLPRSGLGQANGVNSGPPLEAVAYENPDVRAVAMECLRQNQRGSSPWRGEALKRLAPAWCGESEIWEGLAGVLAEHLHCASVWQEISVACTNVALPEPFAATVAALIGVFLSGHEPNNGPWHAALPCVIEFTHRHGLAPRVRHELEYFAGLHSGAPCGHFKALAAAVVMPMLDQEQQRALSAENSRWYAAHPASFKTMTPAMLAALVSPAPDSWKRVLHKHLSALDLQELVLGSGKVHLKLLEALPTQDRVDLVIALLREERLPSLPWLLEADDRRKFRVVDVLWKMVFQSGRDCREAISCE